MKRVIAAILVLSLLLPFSGCGEKSENTATASVEQVESVQEDSVEDSESAETTGFDTADDVSTTETAETEIPDIDSAVSDPISVDTEAKEEPIPEFDGLDDPALLDYMETVVTSELLSQYGTDEYVINNVSARYISSEYLEELDYNSKSNVFFGYSLAELDEQFAGTRYVFTLGDDGTTVVEPFEEYDDVYIQALKNVAVGSGVIIFCVTVSAVSAGAGAPAVSLIFAASAKTGTTFALSSGAISSLISGITTGIQTGSAEAGLKAAAASGSEAFKWGAISGAITGGATETVTLASAAKGGLSLNEVATIMTEHNIPSRFVRQIHSMDEYTELLAAAEKGGLAIEDMASICMNTNYPLEMVKLFRSTEEGDIYYKQAKLLTKTVNGKLALTRKIDLNYQSELGGKMVTNLERMKMGHPPIDPASGKAYELHHVGQSIDSPLAILTKAEHMQGGNNTILHNTGIEEGVHSLIPDAEWNKTVRDFWIAFAETVG